MFTEAVKALKQGEIIAYPTEAVFGLGCDPNDQAAVTKIAHLKKRSLDKGFILISGELEQLNSWVDVAALDRYPNVLASWPGHTTWLVPCKPKTPSWLRGRFSTLAVRISAHPTVRELCAQFGQAILSTSANPSGEPPARNRAEVKAYFPEIHILDGEVDAQAKPSAIYDAQTQTVIRAG